MIDKAERKQAVDMLERLAITRTRLTRRLAELRAIGPAAGGAVSGVDLALIDRIEAKVAELTQQIQEGLELLGLQGLLGQDPGAKS